MIKKIQPQSFLSLGLEHYLTARVLTTCALKAAHSSGLRGNKNPSWKLALPLALFIRASFCCHFDRSKAQSRNLFILLISVKLSARPFFCYFDRSEVQSRNLSYAPDFRKAVRASALLSFRPEQSGVEKSLGAPAFREAIRA
jgi:hypothetical protein